MMKILAALLITVFSLIIPPDLHAAINQQEMRREFDSSFGQLQIYRSIHKYLPLEYENLFQNFLQFKKENPEKSFNPSAFVSSIKNQYFRLASDQALFDFYRYITETGRRIFTQDPEAAFAYLFGGNPSAYATYIEFGTELAQMGRLYERMLSTLSAENLSGLDRQEADLKLDFVFLELYQRYGEKLLLLGRQDLQNLTAEEKASLCDMYLTMHEQILALEAPARGHVLRTLAMRP